MVPFRKVVPKYASTRETRHKGPLCPLSRGGRRDGSEAVCLCQNCEYIAKYAFMAQPQAHAQAQVRAPELQRLQRLCHGDPLHRVHAQSPLPRDRSSSAPCHLVLPCYRKPLSRAVIPAFLAQQLLLHAYDGPASRRSLPRWHDVLSWHHHHCQTLSSNVWSAPITNTEGGLCERAARGMERKIDAALTLATRSTKQSSPIY
jgi:hypothetical protein